MYRLFIFITVLCFFPVLIKAQRKITISGHIYEQGSRESLIGVNVYIPELKAGTTSNVYGFYSITIPSGKYKLVYSYVGYTSDTLNIESNKNIEHDVYMNSSISLSSVEITATLVEKQSQSVQMSTVSVPIQHIKSLPAFLGEKDVMKVLQLMPGVQKGHEGSTGLYVRGGGPDQNLIILDDAVVYNANHLFGFFSLFNGDALKSVEMIKGGFPARYGGRLSSVIDMNMKDGNKEKFSGEAGIGLIASRFTFEGPIVKNKSSFLLSARRTYLDILTKPLMNKEDGIGGYYFYDLNGKVNYDFGRKNKLYVSGYMGRDKFYMSIDNRTSYGDGSKMNNSLFWQNATGTIRWNHLFNEKLFLNTSLITTHYDLTIKSEDISISETYKLRYLSSINDYTVKSDLNYYLSLNHTLKSGIACTYHRFKPSAIVLKNDQQDFSKNAHTIDAFENGIYVEDLMRYGKFQFNPGVRISHFNVGNANYFGLEPRLGGSYNLDENNALKASFASMNQYIHLLSNTGIGLPTDLWVPATEKVPPQKSWQVAAGYVRDLNLLNMSLSVEGYYKEMKNIIGYREGASFIMIEDFETSSEINWENNVTKGNGKSYGTEILLQRKTGKLSGWIGYTLSWTKHQFDELNNGKEFWAKYDRRHDVSVVLIYNPNKLITLSGVWMYGSGEALTLPIGTYNEVTGLPFNKFTYVGQLTDYGVRNEFRMKPYHRFDISLQIHKKKSWGERTWEFSIYNAYNRKNPFFYFIEQEYITNSQGTLSRNMLKQASLFPIIPTVTYSIKF